MLTTSLERIWARVGLVTWGLIGMALPFGLLDSRPLHWSTALYVGCMMWAGPLGATFLLEVVKNIGRGLVTSVKVVTGGSFVAAFVSAVVCLSLTLPTIGAYQCLAMITIPLQVATAIITSHFLWTPRPLALDAYIYL